MAGVNGPNRAAADGCGMPFKTSSAGNPEGNRRETVFESKRSDLTPRCQMKNQTLVQPPKSVTANQTRVRRGWNWFCIAMVSLH
jgi:hypothetical protein